MGLQERVDQGWDYVDSIPMSNLDNPMMRQVIIIWKKNIL
ncbi:hypothetical protein RB2501_01385 [Robiginitalea biformata HTCC2501]|uniref:Uncharacterized protein n=1 Tax=Robiginitalea biformata (strain ATCC BAA-864 / DSM 15991 / KCTC 12146 / HTCC2501) TaxID=313596 RepID=A4CPV2_ROBBH|nr:hypothetical protein RB2501_01385 [Robiginitalea biformata HTCC2501]